MRSLFIIWVLTFSLATGPAFAVSAPRQSFDDKLEGPSLVRALRKGGHVIFIRHAATERDYSDQVTADLADCGTQRVLSEAGWQQAKAIGAAFRALKIPIGKVFASEFCRAWQTADLAFGSYEKRSELNFEKAEDYSEAELDRMWRAMSSLLGAVPAKGENTVLVGHDDPFEAATGIYPEPMGVAFIARPTGDGRFELITELTPRELARLADCCR